MPQQQDAHGYNLQFRVLGLGTLTGKALRVRITRPDGTSFDRLATANDVVVVDETKKLIGVSIKVGDFTLLGLHEYQAFDETGGAFLPTEVGKFYVNENLSPPS